eukprot:7187611-Pyramimonas_sp.AAC.1
MATSPANFPGFAARLGSASSAARRAADGRQAGPASGGGPREGCKRTGRDLLKGFAGRDTQATRTRCN